MSKPAKPAAPAAEGDKAPAKKGGKKKLMIIVLAVLLVGGGAGGWFSGVLPRMLGMGPHEKAEGAHAEGKEGGKEGPGKQAAAEGKAPIFMDLPDMVANLDSGPRRTTFVKLRAKLELSKPEDEAPLKAAMPRVLDLFQGYLREMRPEELRGSASTYRLREELLARTNLAAPPAHVVAVLFTEILVQ